MNPKEMTLPNLTLGWELEATQRAAVKVDGIECGHDGSVGGEGLEYRIKRQHVHDVEKSLRCLRELATDPHLQVNGSCGFHVHIGLGLRTRRLHDWAQWFVQLAREVESDAFKAVPSNRTDNRYCRSWRIEQGAIGGLQYAPNKHDNRDRYQWVNPVEVFRPGGIRTVEIRLMGNSKRYPYLLSWISVCRLMAMSSWALIFDASRLEHEKTDLKTAFKMIRDSFVSGDMTSKQIAKTTVYLATKAGLPAPFGKPLSEIAARERTLVPRAPEGSDEWINTVNHMQQVYNQIRLEARNTPNRTGFAGFLVGDTVLAISEDEDHGIVRGQHYRVTRLLPHHRQSVGLLREPGETWWVRPEHIVLAERLENLTCAD